MSLINEPLLTRTLERDGLMLDSGAAYFFGRGVEDRSDLAIQWRSRMESAGVAFIEVNEDFGPSDLEFSPPASGKVAALARSDSEMRGLFDNYDDVVIDVTGMTYNAWAPLLKGAIDSSCKLRLVYVEPTDYKRSETPSRGMIYDLSERFSQLGPLPGLQSLRRFADSNWLLVALLGFEGSRFAHLVNELEPPAGAIVPVIGVPGFRPEFPTQALIANRSSLTEVRVSTSLRMAKANCPFDAFHALHLIHVDFGGVPMRLAPIGTKPHGIGAVLYALSRPRAVQLVYDHPVRKAKRTEGVARMCVYDVRAFVESDLFRHTGEFAW